MTIPVCSSSGLPLFSAASELDAVGRNSATPLGRRESEASSASQPNTHGPGAAGGGLGGGGRGSIAGPGRGGVAGEERRHGVPPLLSDGSLDYDGESRGKERKRPSTFALIIYDIFVSSIIVFKSLYVHYFKWIISLLVFCIIVCILCDICLNALFICCSTL